MTKVLKGADLYLVRCLAALKSERKALPLRCSWA